MDPWLGMIIHWPLNWAPKGWHICDGSILTIQQNQALYSVIGTKYGGDGKVNFALPDFRSRVPLGYDPRATQYQIGKTGGAETVTLATNQLPAHTHSATIVPNSVTVSGTLTVSQAVGTTPGATSGTSVLAQSNTTTVDINTNNPYEIDAFVKAPVANKVNLANAINAKATGTAPVIAIANTGDGGSHTNLQPYEALNFIIAINGLYPTRAN